jgi:hypothetical protein
MKINQTIGAEEGNWAYLIFVLPLLIPLIILSYIGLPIYYLGSLLGDFFCFCEDEKLKQTNGGIKNGKSRI